MIYQSGDVFLTANSRALNGIINFFQKLWSKDGKSKYAHAGIIVDPDGTTFESLWKVQQRNLNKACKGKKVLVARHENMKDLFLPAYQKIYDQYNKDHYPIYRLLFHMVPPLAKLSTNKVVCSELVAKFLMHCDLMDYYNGCNPDDLHDYLRVAKGWNIIFEGKL